VLNELFGCATRVACEELRRDFVNEAEAVGAVHEPVGTGVHPAASACSISGIIYATKRVDPFGEFL
jgi:hypothetical protein